MSLKSRFSEPGFVVSVVVHVAALGAALVSFSSVQKFDDVQETVPVEMVTDAQFNQIMRGEKSAKEVRPEAVAKAQQVDKVSEIKPTPVVPDQKRDVPAPPPPPPPPRPPVKQAMLDPEPPPPVADLPPERPQTPPAPTPPAPVPPVRNVEAEPVAPKPPEPPKPAPPLPPVVKPVPKPPLPPHPDAAKLHDKTPPPKPKPVEHPRVDQLAKLMEEQPADPAPTKTTPTKVAPSKAKPAPDSSEDSKFDLTDITKLLLSHDAPAQRASRGPDTSHLASLGSPTASAAKMSPSLWAGLDGLLEDQYRQCWSYLGLTTGQKYIPQVRVVYGPNGGLQAEPVLINPPSDPALQNLADSALRAVRRCNPLKIPDQYAPYYELWKGRVLRFDPEEMAG